LKFRRDRGHWAHRLFEARKCYGLRALDCISIVDRVHPLVTLARSDWHVAGVDPVARGSRAARFEGGARNRARQPGPGAMLAAAGGIPAGTR